MTLEQDRFGPKQVQAPESVFGVAQEREPGRSVLIAVWTVVCSQNSADHILVQFDAKSLGQMLCDLRAAKSGLEFTDGSEQFR